jgi:hypothetical protein
MQTETKKFRRRGDGIPRLVALDPAAGTVAASLDAVEPGDHEVARVVKAIAGAHSRGNHVTNTGRQGIFERRLPELSGMSRVSVRAAAKRAVAVGSITLNSGGVSCATRGGRHLRCRRCRRPFGKRGIGRQRRRELN